MTEELTDAPLPVPKKPGRKKSVKGSDKDVTTKTKAILQEEETIKINIPSTERDKLPVFVGINGHSYLINRDEWVSIPKSVLAVLDNAKIPQTTMVKDGQNMRHETRMVSRFSHSTKS